jgi:uncharacterized protein YkwD
LNILVLTKKPDYNVNMSFSKKLRHIFIPHTSNNHKARALHGTSIVLYISLLILIQSGLQTLHELKPNILGYATNINIQDLITNTNKVRNQNGLNSVNINEDLSEAAYNKALDMFNKDYWAHNSPDGVTPWKFIVDSGYTYIVAGENLAKNFNDSESVVAAWMESPSHRENLLKSEYQDIGFAVVDGKLQGEETTLIVQMFGAKKGVDIASLSRPIIRPTIRPTLLPQIPNEAMAVDIQNALDSRDYSTRVIPYELAGVQNDPLIDMRSFKKQLSIAAIMFMIGVLLIDGYFVYTRKKIRIAGRNWAHIIFLLSVLGIIYLSSSGSIL